MAASSITAFWAVALLLIVVPGADWAYVIGTVLGDRSVLLAVSGIVLGYAGMTVVVAAGVGGIVARTPASLTALTIAGGVYLIWLGAKTVTRPTAHAITADVTPSGTGPGTGAGSGPRSGSASGSGSGSGSGAGSGPRSGSASGSASGSGSGSASGSGRATLARGIGVSGLNPKGLLVFLAILPQFTSPRGNWPLTVQLAVLGLVFTLTCAAFYLCIGSFAGKILRARPGAARVITRFSGTAMIVIGALLLAERLFA
jgi:threonine/homoserine/homoserine lactone efflux protein